jgi:hypothetical protein
MKEKLDFETDRQSAEFCELIASRMTALFGISSEEAIGRINRDWRGQKIVGNDIIYHEDEDYWAKTIYSSRSEFMGRFFGLGEPA